jgi:hypothetical protein
MQSDHSSSRLGNNHLHLTSPLHPSLTFLLPFSRSITPLIFLIMQPQPSEANKLHPLEGEEGELSAKELYEAIV